MFPGRKDGGDGVRMGQSWKERKTGKGMGEGKQGAILREQSRAGHLVWGVGEKASKRHRVRTRGGVGGLNFSLRNGTFVSIKGT